MHLNPEQGHEKSMHLKVNASSALKTDIMMRELEFGILLDSFCASFGSAWWWWIYIYRSNASASFLIIKEWGLITGLAFTDGEI